MVEEYQLMEKVRGVWVIAFARNIVIFGFDNSSSSYTIFQLTIVQLKKKTHLLFT